MKPHGSGKPRRIGSTAYVLHPEVDHNIRHLEPKGSLEIADERMGRLTKARLARIQNGFDADGLKKDKMHIDVDTHVTGTIETLRRMMKSGKTSPEEMAKFIESRQFIMSGDSEELAKRHLIELYRMGVLEKHK